MGSQNRQASGVSGSAAQGSHQPMFQAYSVKTARSLYGTPFFRRYPGRICVVTDLIDP